MTAAIILLGVLAVLACFLTAYAYLTREPQGKHARPAEDRRESRLLADPQDKADPDGGDWVAKITGRPACQPGCERLSAHDGRVPGECRIPVPAGMGAGGRLAPLPPDPPPADTVQIPVVTCELGGKTVTEFTDEVFARHEAQAADEATGQDAADGSGTGGADGGPGTAETREVTA